MTRGHRERACSVRRFGGGADLEVIVRHRRGLHAPKNYSQNEADDDLLGTARTDERGECTVGVMEKTRGW